MALGSVLGELDREAREPCSPQGERRPTAAPLVCQNLAFRLPTVNVSPVDSGWWMPTFPEASGTTV